MERMSSAVLAWGLKRGLGVEEPEEGADMAVRWGSWKRWVRVMGMIVWGCLGVCCSVELLERLGCWFGAKFGRGAARLRCGGRLIGASDWCGFTVKNPIRSSKVHGCYRLIRYERRLLKLRALIIEKSRISICKLVLLNSPNHLQDRLATGNPSFYVLEGIPLISKYNDPSTSPVSSSQPQSHTSRRGSSPV